MKNNFKTTTQLLVGVAAIGILSASVFAWTAPTQAPTGGNVPAPVNTGANPQTKSSSLSVIGNLTAASVLPGQVVSGIGNVIASSGVFGQLVNGTRGVFGCLANCSTDTNVFRAGKHINQGNLGQGIAATLEKGLVVNQNGIPSTVNAAFWVSLLGNTGSLGRNVMTLLISDDNVSSPNQENNTAVFQTNAERFSLYNLAGNAFVGLTAKNIRLTDGAAAGKVLTSDANGYASWGDGTNQSVPPAEPKPAIALIVRNGSSASPYKHSDDGGAIGTCSPDYPILISMTGACKWAGPVNRTRLAETTILHLGTENTPGEGQAVCYRDGVNGELRDIRLVCANKDLVTTANFGGALAPVWHDVPIASGNWGQSCQSWLNTTSVIPYGSGGFASQPLGSFTTGISAKANANGAIVWNPENNKNFCIYEKNENTLNDGQQTQATMMSSGNVGTAGTWTGSRYAPQLKTFSNPNWRPVTGIGSQISSVVGFENHTLTSLKTMVKY